MQKYESWTLANFACQLLLPNVNSFIKSGAFSTVVYSGQFSNGGFRFLIRSFFRDHFFAILTTYINNLAILRSFVHS